MLFSDKKKWIIKPKKNGAILNLITKWKCQSEKAINYTILTICHFGKYETMETVKKKKSAVLGMGQ